MAPLTAATLYVFELPEQAVVLPVMAPGCVGSPTVTATTCAADDPQEVLAVTEMFPPVDVAVALMEAVVEVPVQPEGNVQV